MNYDTYKLATPLEYKECKFCNGNGYIKVKLENIELQEKVFVDTFEVDNCKQCDGSGITF